MKKKLMCFVALVSAVTLSFNTFAFNVHAEGGHEETAEVTDASETVVETVVEESLEESLEVAPEETSEVVLKETGNESETELKTITGFAEFNIADHYQHISVANKPSEDNLISRFPDKLEVYLDGSASATEIDVTWFCVGDEYKEEVYYYQFSPRWDEESYVLAGGINLLTDAPYIGVFVDGNNNNSLSRLRSVGVYGVGYETQIFEYLVGSLGISRAAACGIMANIYSESAFNPQNLQDSFEKSLGFTDSTYTSAVDNGSYTAFSSDRAGYGLCQWSYSTRKGNLLAYKKSKGTSIGDYKMQLEFMKNEFNSYPSVKTAVESAANSADGAYDVGYRYCYSYEAPASKDTKSPTRGNLARDKFWPYYKDYTLSSFTTTIEKPAETTSEETTSEETTPEVIAPEETTPESPSIPDGIVKAADGTLAIYKGGIVDTSFNGFEKFENAWWYFKNGQTNADIDGLYKGVVDGKTALWYCVDSKVDFSYNSLCKADGIWWYCKSGAVDTSYTGLCEYKGVLFYIEKGQINWNYSSLCKYNGIWWYCRYGQVDKNFSGVCEYQGVLFYIEKGQINWNYNNLFKYNDKWWYFKYGQVDKAFVGFFEYKGVLFYIANGQINWSYNSLCKYDGIWWYCRNGQIDKAFTGPCEYKNTLFYIENGKVNWSYSGFCKYKDTWYYFKYGQVDPACTGIYQGTVNGTSAQWYVSSGKVNTSYTGSVSYAGKTYNVVNGKVASGYSIVYSSYTTTYKESQTNRTTNLKLACKAINGTIIPNGGTFSFNGIVGERTAAKGYKEAIIYEGGQETGGIGGGICQVATTIFNAALKANFKIVERHQHSLTVHYVPLGYDAAIAWGAKNLRWTNNSGVPIKVEATCASGKLSIRFLTDKIVAPPAVKTQVTLSNRVYTLKRYVNGVCNYTTTSKYADI